MQNRALAGAGAFNRISTDVGRRHGPRGHGESGRGGTGVNTGAFGSGHEAEARGLQLRACAVCEVLIMRKGKQGAVGEEAASLAGGCAGG